MIYTQNDIVTYLYTILKNSNLVKNVIDGNLYKRGTRKPDAQTEDAVIGFIAGTSEQVQQGDVVLNVYVPDVKTKDGFYYCNIARCTTIERQLIDIPDLLTRSGDIRFETNGMICTLEEPEIKQHFVSLKMRFKVLSNY